ncbi:MAG: Fic family protein [Saprospiraceae bacterium]
MEILKRVTELKAELDSLRPLNRDRETYIMQKLRLDWNYHSNHLEGNSLTFGETKALILFGITAAGKPLKDHFEMTGHDEAVKWIEEVVKEGRPLTENFIRELHLLILKEPYESPTITPDGIPAKRKIQVGVYKSAPNHVLTPTGEIFRFATPEETPAMMHDLIQWYRQKEGDPETHPLLLAAEFHYKFIRIHPFDDGNGRTARILMNFILMKYGYPPVIIKTEDKANYIAALQQSDAGIIAPFIEYIGQNLAHSLDVMIRGAKGENIDEPDDVDKEIALIEQKIKIIGSELKSIKTIEKILESSLFALFQEYISQSLKFANFYKKTFLNLTVDDISLEYVVEDNKFYRWNKEPDQDIKLKDLFYVLQYLSEKGFNIVMILKGLVTVKKKVDLIKLSFSYKSFDKVGFKEFDYNSAVEIFFDSNNFKIAFSKNKNILKIKYHEVLTIEKINSVIRNETKAHTDFINQQIEKAQQKTE